MVLAMALSLNIARKLLTLVLEVCFLLENSLDMELSVCDAQDRMAGTAQPDCNLEGHGT